MVTRNSEGPRWKRLDPEDRKSDILAVARKHFAAQHYSAVSTAEIASDVGINRGLLYHYFGTKRQLYLEVLRTSLMVPNLPPVPFLEASGRLEEVLDEIIDTWLGEVEDQRDVYLAFSRIGGFGADEEAESIANATRNEAVDRALKALYDDPAQAPQAIRASLRALGNLVEGAVAQWLVEGALTRDQTRVLLSISTRALWANIGTILDPPPLATSGKAAAAD